MEQSHTCTPAPSLTNLARLGRTSFPGVRQPSSSWASTVLLVGELAICQRIIYSSCATYAKPCTAARLAYLACGLTFTLCF